MSVLVLPDSLSMSPVFCRFCSRRNSGWWSRLWHWTAQAETCIRHLQVIRVLRGPYAPWCLCSGPGGPWSSSGGSREKAGQPRGEGGLWWGRLSWRGPWSVCRAVWGAEGLGSGTGRPQTWKGNFLSNRDPPRENCQQTLFRGRRGHGDKGRRRAAWSPGRDAEWEKHRPFRLCKSQKQGRLAPCSCQNTQRLSAKITTMAVILQETKMNHG